MSILILRFLYSFGDVIYGKHLALLLITVISLIQPALLRWALCITGLAAMERFK